MNSVYEGKIVFIDMKKDELNPHQHFGYHPYAVVKKFEIHSDYFEDIYWICPCSSIFEKRRLPTQIRLTKTWNKATTVLCEQLISVPASVVERGNIGIEISELDMQNIIKAISVQLALNSEPRDDKMKGKVYFFNLPQSDTFHRLCGNRPYILMSNDKCNENSPVVHLLPVSQYRSDCDIKDVHGLKSTNGFAIIPHLVLVSKKYISELEAFDKIKWGSMFGLNAKIKNSLTQAH